MIAILVHLSLHERQLNGCPSDESFYFGQTADHSQHLPFRIIEIRLGLLELDFDFAAFLIAIFRFGPSRLSLEIGVDLNADIRKTKS